MSSIFTHVRKPVSDTNNEPGLPVIEIQRVTAKASSDPSSVWNFCALSSEVISRRNQSEMSAVFSGYLKLSG